MQIRKLALSDLSNYSFYETLSNLRPTHMLPLALAEKVYEQCEQSGIETYVAEIDGAIIGSIRLLFEPKYYHGGKAAAHIEDVVTHKDHVGRGISRALIEYSIEVCRSKGCYKIILDCEDKLVDFYAKFGFKRFANAMRIDF